MESLRKRLSPHKQSVLRMVRLLSRGEAMRAFNVKDDVCFQAWLKEVTGDENYGLNCRLSTDPNETLGDKLIDALLRKVAHHDAENKRLRERIDYLEWELGIKGMKEQDQVLAVLEACQVEGG